MLELRDAISTDLFSDVFPNVSEKIVATNMQELIENRSKDITAISLFVWDEMVHRGITKDPYKIGPICNNNFTGIYPFVEKELGKPPVSDAYAVSYFNEIDTDMSFADLTIVQCFPDDIHIGDVEFSDNRRPIRPGKPKKGVRCYHGLHVFGAFIDRLDEVARSRGVERISLMVAESELYPVFKRHGFEVSKTQMAQLAFNGPRTGFPMIRPVSKG